MKGEKRDGSRERGERGRCIGRQMQIGRKIKKIKSEEGEGQKIKYRSVHWNNAGSLVRDNGLDQCFLSSKYSK